jgi:hypothetical protein
LRSRAIARDDPAMRVLAAIGLMILFAIGGVLGLVIGLVVVPISLYRGARAVHADGVVCRAELVVPGAPALSGPALVRLSGAFHDQRSTSADVLGLDLRLQRTASDDPRAGDQDLLFGSFESFATAGRDRDATVVDDYLANCYSTVTPWWLAPHGAVTLRLVPPKGSAVSPAARGHDRLSRIDADLAADRARFALAIGDATAHQVIGELRLVERLAIDDRSLRASMFRHGRGVRPLGLRNGIRATVYPMSQVARRLRGG